VSRDHNVYFSLRNQPSPHPSIPTSPYTHLRDNLVRFKRSTKTVNGSMEMVKHSIALVLWERGLLS
jgi:hypothetical protein